MKKWIFLLICATIGCQSNNGSNEEIERYKEDIKNYRDEIKVIKKERDSLYKILNEKSNNTSLEVSKKIIKQSEEIDNNGESFKLNDVILLRKSNFDFVQDFLKSRFFTYVGRDQNAYSFGLNYDNYSKTSTVWVYKYFDGKIKVYESEHNLLPYIKSQLNNYKIETGLYEDETIWTNYKYNNYDITLEENDLKKKYSLYIE